MRHPLFRSIPHCAGENDKKIHFLPPPLTRRKEAYTIVPGGGHHRTPSGGLQTTLAGVSPGYLGMGGMGGIHAAQAYGMATPRLMQVGLQLALLFRLLVFPRTSK